MKESEPTKYGEFNHKGSVPGMERDGTVNIFKRSIENNKLKYVNFMVMETPKSICTVEDIYPDTKVKEFECIGHVQKRMGKRLRTLRKTVKGLGGSGRLNDAMVDKIQNYYGIAIRRNTGKDYNTMKKAIWTAFFHVTSSKDREWHDHCQPGPNSWCKYQVDLANKTNTYNPGSGLAADIIKHVKLSLY